MQSGNTGRLCRDENCDRLGLHLKHEVAPKDPRDEVEISRSKNEPWKRSAPKALDHSIAKATSKVYPKPLDVIMREVEYDYGSCNERTVQRRLRRLIERGHVVRIDLGRRLYAYVRPGSNMINEIDLVREQLDSLMATA